MISSPVWAISAAGAVAIILVSGVMKAAGFALSDIQWFVATAIMVLSIVLGPIYTKSIA